MGSDLSHSREYFCNNIKERYYCDSIKGVIIGHEMYNFDLKMDYSWNKFFFSNLLISYYNVIVLCSHKNLSLRPLVCPTPLIT